MPVTVSLHHSGTSINTGIFRCDDMLVRYAAKWAARIVSPRLGCHNDTVLAMLDSGHVRGMRSEVKRACVRMALQAAGIPVNKFLQDVAKRLDALHADEAGERIRFEEYEARKSRGSAQIQLEIERMTAHSLDR